jgi:hypothetical protein
VLPPEAAASRKASRSLMEAYRNPELFSLTRGSRMKQYKTAE